MNNNIKDPGDKTNNQIFNLKHLIMMTICCGLPILIVLVLPVFGFGDSEYFFLIACPIGMGIMMYMMHVTHNGKKGDGITKQKVKVQSKTEFDGGPNNGYSSFQEQKDRQDKKEHQKRKNNNHSCCH